EPADQNERDPMALQHRDHGLGRVIAERLGHRTRARVHALVRAARRREAAGLPDFAARACCARSNVALTSAGRVARYRARDSSWSSAGASDIRRSKPAALRMRSSVSSDGAFVPDSYAEIAVCDVRARRASSTWLRP